MSNMLRTIRRGAGLWNRGEARDRSGYNQRRPRTTGTFLDRLRDTARHEEREARVVPVNPVKRGILDKLRAFFGAKPHARGV